MSLQSVSLGSLVNIKTGKLDANAAVDNGKYPFFTCAREELRIDSYSYDCDAILIAGNGDLNVKHYKGKFDAYQRTYILTLLDESRVNIRYLYFYLETYVERLRDLSIGGVIKYIKLGMLTDALVPLPPLETQKQIAAILEKADQLRKDCQQMEQELNNLAQSVFMDMFGDPVSNPMGWEIKPLKDLLSCKPQIGTTKPSHGDGTQKVVRVGELGSREIKYSKCAPITLEGRDHEKYKLESGDFLLARAIGSRDHLGKASLFIEQEDSEYVYDSHVMRLRFDEERMMSRFFYELLKTHGGRTLFLNSSSQTAVQFNINAKQISDINIPSPPINMQKQFLKNLDALINLDKSNKLIARDFDRGFNALLKKAFNGELNIKSKAA